MLTDKQKSGVDRVIGILKAVPERLFHMEHVFFPEMIENDESAPHCGSPVCIGGWCAATLYLENPSSDFLRTQEAFEVITGVERKIAGEICFPLGSDANPYSATRDQAVRLLEILRDDGFVDWDRAMS